MSDTDWMEAEAYNLADRFNEALDKAYKQGINDAWSSVKDLWDRGICSFDWSADEMMKYADRDEKCRIKVKSLADEIGIHALYAMVRDMRGEQDE